MLSDLVDDLICVHPQQIKLLLLWGVLVAVPGFILVPRWLIAFEVLIVDLENTPHKSLYSLYNVMGNTNIVLLDNQV